MSLPTVTRQKVLEEKSRIMFAEAVSPWLVTEWTQHDYGIDAIVEITRECPSGNGYEATGKRFAVQLKATEKDLAEHDAIQVRVRPEQIRYWLKSLEPVLLVCCQVPVRCLYWRWIDYAVVEELTRRDPSWIGQQTISITVPTAQRIDAEALNTIAGFVSSFQHRAYRVLVPGAYLDLQARLGKVAAELIEHSRQAGFESVTKRLTDLESSIRNSTYVVALAGPARAGKSTLLNALVGKEVSPVGRLPTTAAPLIVMAGPRNEAEVVLTSGVRIVGEATTSFLEEYATQDKNPDNQKGVRMVAVRLVNQILERGVAYADAPGLHDPSAEIRTVTETALQAAHAVIYIIDASPARNGGFFISKHHIEDLARLRSMADRLFIVLNKDDAISPADRKEVTKYIEQTLQKYNILDSLPLRPVFLSALRGWQWHQAGRNGKSPLFSLEDAIWAHLLRTNSTGIDRLYGALNELQRAGEDFASLLAARRISGGEAFRLDQALETCRRGEGELVARCRQRSRIEEAFITNRLTERHNSILGHLQGRLDNVPLDQPLPTTSQIEAELQNQILRTISEAWRDVSTRCQNFASLISQDVEKSLQQVRLATTLHDNRQILLPQIPPLNIAAESFEEAWTGLFSGGFLGLLIGGSWIGLLAVGGLLAGLIFGREKRRKREIKRIVEHSRNSMTLLLRSGHGQIREKVRMFFSSLERHVTDRISVFTHDVERQLSKLESPITPAEEQCLKAHERAVRTSLEILKEVLAQIESDSCYIQHPPAAATQ